MDDRVEVAQARLSLEHRLGEVAWEHHWLTRELVAGHETTHTLALTRDLFNFLLRGAFHLHIGEADLLLHEVVLLCSLLTFLPVILFIFCFLARTIVYIILTSFFTGYFRRVLPLILLRGRGPH